MYYINQGYGVFHKHLWQNAMVEVVGLLFVEIGTQLVFTMRRILFLEFHDAKSSKPSGWDCCILAKNAYIAFASRKLATAWLVASVSDAFHTLLQ
jgi:hypothetical protein